MDLTCPKCKKAYKAKLALTRGQVGGSGHAKCPECGAGQTVQLTADEFEAQIAEITKGNKRRAG